MFDGGADLPLGGSFTSEKGSWDWGRWWAALGGAVRLRRVSAGEGGRRRRCAGDFAVGSIGLVRGGARAKARMFGRISTRSIHRVAHRGDYGSDSN